MFACVLERTRRVGLGPMLTYALGRFPQVRGSYGAAMGLLQRLDAVHVDSGVRQTPSWVNS
jgi:hypothetical protein